MKSFSSVVVTLVCLVVLTVPSWAADGGAGGDGDGGPAPWCAPDSQCCNSIKNPGTSDKPCCYLCVRSTRTFGDINAPLTQFEYRSLMSVPVSSATKRHDLERLASEDYRIPETTKAR
jgi:hypothetical protein